MSEAGVEERVVTGLQRVLFRWVSGIGVSTTFFCSALVLLVLRPAPTGDGSETETPA